MSSARSEESAENFRREYQAVIDGLLQPSMDRHVGIVQ